MSFIEAISTQPPSFRVPCLFLYTSLSHPKLKWALMVKMMIPRTTSIRELGISAILCIILEPFFSAAKKKDVRRIPNGLLLASSAITTPSFPMELLNRAAENHRGKNHSSRTDSAILCKIGVGATEFQLISKACFVEDKSHADQQCQHDIKACICIGIS